jgi:hypothetical protein
MINNIKAWRTTAIGCIFGGVVLADIWYFGSMAEAIRYGLGGLAVLCLLVPDKVPGFLQKKIDDN